LAKRVFISYRRDDTASVARLVYDRLWRVLSKLNVFFDVSTVAGGDDFDKKIATAIDKSDAALVLIGDRWLIETSTGQARIWEKDDYVRAEVREALARPILVVPILVSGAEMPKAEQLPEDVRAITTRSALPLRHVSFDDDAENIIATILGERPRDRHWERQTSIWSQIFYATGGAVLAAVILLIIALLHFWLLARPLSVSIGMPMTVLMIVITIILGGWAGIRHAARRPARR
jgi:TIR domain